MTTTEAQQLLRNLDRQAQSTLEIAKTARRGGKSLCGDNPYGRKFHAAVVEISVIEGKLRKFLKCLAVPEEETAKLGQLLDALRDPKSLPPARSKVLKDLQSLCRTVIMPQLEGLTASSVPETEQVLQASVVAKSRGYIEKIVAQANGAYHHQWYDACAVMMRRLIETLIIEVYEAKGKSSEIKNGAGDFQMLGDLVSKILNDSKLNLSRNCKEVLPKVKELGDMSAHSRRFNATKRDVDALLSKFGAAVQDLLDIAGLR